MIDVDRVHLALRVEPLLGIAAAVAILAYLLNRRLVFATGIAGMLLGLQLPRPVVRANYGTIEAAEMAYLDGMFRDSLEYGLIGAVTGVLLGYLLSILWRRWRRSWSTRRQDV